MLTTSKYNIVIDVKYYFTTNKILIVSIIVGINQIMELLQWATVSVILIEYQMVTYQWAVVLYFSLLFP